MAVYRCVNGPEDLAVNTWEQRYDRAMESQQPGTDDKKKRSNIKLSCKVGCQFHMTVSEFKARPGLVEVTRSHTDHNVACQQRLRRPGLSQHLRDEVRTWFENESSLTAGHAIERVQCRYRAEMMEEHNLGSELQAAEFIAKGIKAKTCAFSRDFLISETDAKNIKDKVDALVGALGITLNHQPNFARHNLTLKMS